MHKLVEQFFNNVLVSSPEWMAMLANVENSRWHREANTAVHTMMMINWYEQNRSYLRDDRQQIFTELAILFHDFGKPQARTEKFSEERGTYASFADHERVSARMFEHYMTKNSGEHMKTFGLSSNDVYAISFMIENHLPYKLAADAKRVAVQARRRSMKTTIVKFIDETDPAYSLNIFYDLLLADQNGRISDNAEQELKEVDEWIAAFDKEKLTTFDLDPNKKVHFVIAPNSVFGNAVKNRYISCLMVSNAAVFNVIDSKMQFYEQAHGSTPTVAKAVEYAKDDLNKYNQFAQKQFEKLLAEGHADVVVVGNFSTPKSRGMYVSMASKHQYKSVGCVVFDSLDMVKFLANNNFSSAEKIHNEVKRYFGVVLPFITSDFDEIVVRTPIDM